jgi:hypothetical protein
MGNKWEKRFAALCLFGWLGLASLPFFAGAAFSTGFLQGFCIAAGLLLFVPGFIYLYVVILLHWKDRYRGRHSDLWGVLILIETTGWMKLVYLFRHLIPDMRHSGRYRLKSSQAV